MMVNVIFGNNLELNLQMNIQFCTKSTCLTIRVMFLFKEFLKLFSFKM